MNKLIVLLLVATLSVISRANDVRYPGHQKFWGGTTSSLSDKERREKLIYNELYDYYDAMAKLLRTYCVSHPNDIRVQELVTKFNAVARSPRWDHLWFGRADDREIESLRCSLDILKRHLQQYPVSVPPAVSRHSCIEYTPPQELLALTEFSNEYVVSRETRTWTDVHGKKLQASWAHISKDGKLIFLKNTNGKYISVKLSSLSKADNEHVTNLLSTFASHGWMYLNGTYVEPETYKRFLKREKIKSIILSKDQYAFQTAYLKVFQVLGADALCCQYMQDNSAPPSTVKFMQNHNEYLTDGSVIDRRLYWCGTWNYISKDGTDRTVNCFTDDVNFAIAIMMHDTQTPSRPSLPTAPSTSPLHCTGSGFFITTNGYFVTNHHVIKDGKEFAIMTTDGRYEATVILSDPDTDLALLRVNNITTMPIPFAKRKTEGLGATVLTMGFPQPGLQGFEPKVTKGVISGGRGFKGDVREYQIDASIQPGNSGGPLFNEHGCLVGVVVASLIKGQLVNYAIKKSYLQAFLDNAPECANGIIENDGNESDKNLEDIVANVRKSCVFVLTYK